MQDGLKGPAQQVLLAARCARWPLLLPRGILLAPGVCFCALFPPPKRM